MTEASNARAPSAGSPAHSSNGSRRTPVIRLHGAPTLSPRPAPKKGGRRASEFYFREPEYLAPPRSTVSTPPPGRKRSASLPHVRSPSPVPPPLARAARAHHAAQQHGRGGGGGKDEDNEEDEDEARDDRADEVEEKEDVEERDEEGAADQQQPHRSRLLGTTAADRRKSMPCQPRFLPGRRGRPSLDLSAGHGAGHITLGSHLDSEIARRRHSVSATGSPGPAKTTTTAAGAVERGVPPRRADALADRANTQRGTAGPESWFEEASSSEDDDEGGDRFAVDTRPTPATPNSSPVVSAATASSRRPVS